MTVAVFAPTAEFIGYAHYKNESWVFSSISLLVGDMFTKQLKEKGVQDKVITTQVVPALDSPLPIVTEARKNLGTNLNYTCLLYTSRYRATLFRRPRAPGGNHQTVRLDGACLLYTSCWR